jgi:DNA polymerase-3 subunit gamma/tau
VRDVLGLVGDDLYADVLRLVAERRPAEVFPLIDRLSDAGADLAEFMGGAGETLRAVLMLQLGQEPEGLTEAMRATLEEFRDRLEAGDVLRMLRLLTESETSIRRSVNPRLVVETLLLRWAMMDRIVDLTQVLASQPRSGGPGPVVRTSRPPAPPPQSSAPDRGSTAVAPAQPSDAGEGAPSGLEDLRHSWQAIVSEVRGRSRFLGEALAHTMPLALDPIWVTVVFTEPNQLFTERLQAQAGVVEEVLQRVTGRSLRLRVTESAPGDGPPPAQRALSEASMKADRLRGFRAKDPALDTAADALDLEIVD